MMGEKLTFQKKNGQKIAGKAYFAGVDKEISDGDFCPRIWFQRDLEHHGAGFAESGINCIFFDFCGGGLKSLSDGKMTQMTVLTEAEDLTEVISQVQQMENVDSDQLFIQGESQGGFVGAYVAAQIPEKIKGLIFQVSCICDSR